MEVTMNSSTQNIVKSDRSVIKSYIIQPFLLGLMGFAIVLLTLVATYFVTAKFFHIGYFAIDTTDLLISSLGFVLLSWYTLRKNIE